MYKSLQEVVIDLEKSGQLLRIKHEVDGNLEAAKIHREIFDRGGPAILFERIKGSPFSALSNLYGTFERTDYLFRKTLPKVKKVIELKADPTRFFKKPFDYLSAPITALTALPKKTKWSAASTFGQTTIDKLPLIKSWPMDGGAFITMPQVFTLPPNSKNIMESNLGMYRIQLNGNDYMLNNEVGLHYQLHRGIGVHHTAYNESDAPFKCSIFVGGPPSHAFSAIMPMPEGLSELTFAGMLAGRRFRYHFDDMGHVVSNDADFVITGTIQKNKMKPEGPFGDHLGYYSLTHDFPYMKIDRVYHRKDAIWHFSVVGRPPMEDSSFGYLIHKLVKDLTAGEFPGVKEIHAVDAAGVHPLLLAIGRERYMPFREQVPEEILTIANRIIGSGQTSLAKYLIIAAEDEYKNLNCHDIPNFLNHILERVDWKKDLHFHTRTTIDTLDYSGEGWNSGSKLIIACRGKKRRNLETNTTNLPNIEGVKAVSCALPGILCIESKPWTNYKDANSELARLSQDLKTIDSNQFPLIVIVDNSAFTSATLNNFLWVTFTRSNPSHDVYGVDQFIENKHWGCEGSLIIDARKKGHHAPELIG
jgi:4-hydroxy-3-polyprenylbenzoate decarboxylase